MSEDDLVQNGYPRPCPTAPGKAVFKSRKEQLSKDRKCVACGHFSHLVGTATGV